MGGHVMLRGGEARTARAFGGGVAYGHQVGNGRWRVRGQLLRRTRRRRQPLLPLRSRPRSAARAVLPTPPHELVLQVQGAGGRFPGVRDRLRCSDAAQREAARLLDTVLSTLPRRAADARRARASTRNGGIGALHVAYYASHGFYADMRS